MKEKKDFLEKVIKDNENLVLLSQSLESQIERAKESLENCRNEVLAQMEPKIKQLVNDHQKELQKKKIEVNYRIKAEKNDLVVLLEKKRKQLSLESSEIENECKAKLVKFKNRYEKREKEINELWQKRIMELEKETELMLKDQDDDEKQKRLAWKAVMFDKIKKEFEIEMKKPSVPQDVERELMEAVRLTENEQYEQQKALSKKLEKEEKEHQILMKKLNNQISELENEIIRIETEMLNKIEEKKTIMQELNSKASKCKCKEYNEQIIRVRSQIEELEKESKNNVERYESRRKDITQSLQIITKDCDSLKSECIILQERINSENAKHKKEISLISERVKATIEKKDRAYQQLLSKLENARI